MEWDSNEILLLSNRDEHLLLSVPVLVRSVQHTHSWDRNYWINLLFQCFDNFLFNGQDCHPFKKLTLKVGNRTHNKSDHVCIVILFVTLCVNSLHKHFPDEMETLLDGNVDICYTGKLTISTIIQAERFICWLYQ